MTAADPKPLPQFASDMLASLPKRGGGLNIALFRTARVLHAFRTEEQIIETLRAVTHGEPLQRGEIERAVARSKSCAWQPGQPSGYVATPAWPKIDKEKRAAVIQKGGGLVDLWEASPIRLEDDEPRCEEVVDLVFPGDPLLCVGRSKSSFDTRTRSQWRGKLAGLTLIVPNAMTARRGVTQDGKESAHALSNTGPRHFLVIEQDSGTIDDQAVVLLHLREFAPLALAVHSGSKSIHGWFACGDEPEQTVRSFMEYAVSLGADRQLWTRSQFVRMPDGRRENGRRQTVFYFNPEAVTE
jgi:hypothetical protein